VATEAPSGAVSSLDDVEKAVVQIEADGTFVDPEVGWQVNVGKYGTGFIIDPSGLAITNNHVVTGAALLKVWVSGESKPRNAKILGVSECSDLAVIDIEGDGYPYLEWFDGKIKVGTKVYAAGFPLGDPNYTLRDGIVSKASADGETSWASVDSVIEHSAKILPGNSGGPLVNEEGKVIGINYAGVNETDQNFAIGRDEALPVIDQLKAKTNVDSIGINGGAVSGSVSDTPISGVWVRSVASGSPADKALIKPGDIVYQLEGQVLATDGTMASYCDILRTHEATDTLSVTVIRFDDMSLMEGQVNGRELTATGYFTDASGSSATPGATSDYVTVTDDTNTIQLDIPATWTDTDGSVWESDWSGFTFTAPSISATTSFDDFNSYLAPGVFFSASDRWGQLGGFVQLLDGVRGWFEDDCKLDRSNYRVDYDDQFYEGKFDVWQNCRGTGTNVLVLAARPKSDQTAYLILVEIHYITQEDLDSLDQILNTFQVVGNF
jgi:serine protease Do